jgi:hypothetical protein
MVIKIAFGPLSLTWIKGEFITLLCIVFVGREFDESRSEEIAHHHYFTDHYLPHHPHLDIG